MTSVEQETPGTATTASTEDLLPSLESLALIAVRVAALAAAKHAGLGDGKAADGAA
ncbi:MAG: hypothetical protein QOJ85_1506, partial [Solirubrobacteraceae bacterium]|nr:hypothetical protein [Solirubrobacteraceae bacterium]